MLSPSWDTIRLFLHVLAATIWVGGQLTLAGLVPVIRGVSPDATKLAARQFARLSWPAYGVLVVTGIWNLIALNPSAQSGAWNATLDVKLGVVLMAGVAAYAHQKSTSTLGLAVWGALTALFSLGALFIGILLAG